MLFLNYTSARATETEKCNAYKVKQPGCKMTANYLLTFFEKKRVQK